MECKLYIQNGKAKAHLRFYDELADGCNSDKPILEEDLPRYISIMLSKLKELNDK